MNSIIFIYALIGALGGFLISFIFKGNKKSADYNSKKDMKMDSDSSERKEGKSIFDRWSIRLALVGLGMGVFAAFGQGYTQIGFMIGFGIPFALILGIIGLVIDLVKPKK